MEKRQVQEQSLDDAGPRESESRELAAGGVRPAARPLLGKKPSVWSQPSADCRRRISRWDPAAAAGEPGFCRDWHGHVVAPLIAPASSGRGRSVACGRSWENRGNKPEFLPLRAAESAERNGKRSRAEYCCKTFNQVLRNTPHKRGCPQPLSGIVSRLPLSAVNNFETAMKPEDAESVEEHFFTLLRATTRRLPRGSIREAVLRKSRRP